MEEDSTPCFSEEISTDKNMNLFSIFQSLMVTNTLALTEAEQVLIYDTLRKSMKLFNKSKLLSNVLRPVKQQ